jgi:HK97 gp10 family phage protein
MPIVNHFGAIAARLKPKAHALVAETIAVIETNANAIVPVDTGALQASIESHMESDTHGVVSANTDYAGYVEFGTTRAPAQPYMHPSFDAARPAFDAGLARLLEP